MAGVACFLNEGREPNELKHPFFGPLLGGTFLLMNYRF